MTDPYDFKEWFCLKHWLELKQPNCPECDKERTTENPDRQGGVVGDLMVNREAKAGTLKRGGR